MSQVNIIEAFSDRTEKFIVDAVLVPIVKYLAQKGISESVDSLRNVLNISMITVSNTPVINNYEHNATGLIGNNMGPPEPSSKAAPKKTGRAKANPTNGPCKHILSKSKDNNGKECGKPAFAFERCKACLKKTIVKTQLASKGITSEQIDAVLKSEAVEPTVNQGINPNVIVSTLSNPMTPAVINVQDEFKEVQSTPGVFLHTNSNLIVRKDDKGYNAIAILKDGQGAALDSSHYQLIKSSGFIPPTDMVAPDVYAPAPVSVSGPISIQIPVSVPQEIKVVPQNVPGMTQSGMPIMPSGMNFNNGLNIPLPIL